MPHMKIGLAALSVTVLLVGASPAFARAQYENEIPSSPNGCNTCHSNGGGSARNAFGLDVESNIVGGSVDWSALYDLDSDDDGQTNGQELGDPCGNWTGGSAPRTADISDPADDSSTSADPDGGCDSEGGEPETGEPDGEPAGCGGANATNEGPPAALAALGLAIAMMLRRRRR